METDDAHERRLTQALQALGLFLEYFEDTKRSDLTDHFKTIFDSGKFWKLDKIKSIHVNFLIRKKFFCMIFCLFNRFKHHFIVVFVI